MGSADDSVNSDKEAVAKAVTAEAVKTAGYESLDAAKEDGTAFVFMGHGTSHTAKISYSQMQNQMNALGYDNVFIGTVEGEPEDTACEAVIEKLEEIDAILNEKATGWKTSRMNKVDLAILRLAVYEIKWDDDVPVKVAINEAVELAKKFSGEEGPAFVNGVLAKIAD